MKLYTYDPAPNPRRLTLFMQYKGIELDTQQIDLMTKEQHGDSYGTINPSRTVPALVLDDGEILTEVTAICTYLEALHPEKPLLGSSALERARIANWTHKLFNTVFMPIAEILRNANPAFKDRALPGPLPIPQIAELAQRGELRLKAIWPSLDKHLANTPWVAGDIFSQADIDLLTGCEFSGWVKQTPPESLKHLHDWQARCKEALEACRS